MTIEICRLVRTRRRIASVVALAAIVCSAPAEAGMSVIYSFKGEEDGAPAGPLVQDNQGALYGVAAGGGALNGGTVFKLAPPVAPATSWTKTTIYSFAPAPNDYLPYSLTIDSAGSLYGVTGRGGIHGFGSVYKLSPPVPPATSWTSTNLYDFEGGNDGAYPNTGLVFDVSGALYGTTRGGGQEAGVVFKLKPSTCGAPFSYEVIHTFTPPISYPPFTEAETALTFDANGTLYGAIQSPYSHGAVFSLTPPVAPATSWTLKVLRDGLPFNRVVLDSRGSLYGTTRWDGSVQRGFTFKLTPPVAPSISWRYTTLSMSPHLLKSVVLDNTNGALYGTTSFLDTRGGGFLFKLTPPVAPSLNWTSTMLHEFDFSTDGGEPSSLFIGANGALYGTTNRGRRGVFQFVE